MNTPLTPPPSHDTRPSGSQAPLVSRIPPAPTSPAHPVHRTPPVGGLIVTTDSLTKTYGGVAVVDDLDLRVPAGGVYGFLGPNGAGKSTTMKLLLGLTRPTSGTMSIMGSPVGPRSPLPAGTIGSLIERPACYPSLTGAENLAMLASYLRLPRNRVADALATVDLTAQADKQVRHYSLGMRQRLGLAMALLAEPPLLLLDEPTNGLDPAGVAEIRGLITGLAHNRATTVVVSSHILSEIEQMADTVGIICAGQLRYQGPLSGLQEEGVIEFVVSEPTRAAELLDRSRVPHRDDGAVLRTPMLPDDVTGRLVTDLVRAGHTVYRVQTVRMSLEQAFLRLTEPDIPANAPVRSSLTTAEAVR